MKQYKYCTGTVLELTVSLIFLTEFAAMSNVEMIASSSTNDGEALTAECREPLSNIQTLSGDAQVDQRFDFPPLPDDFGESPSMVRLTLDTLPTSQCVVLTRSIRYRTLS